jgi:hypothetical protein
MNNDLLSKRNGDKLNGAYIFDLEDLEETSIYNVFKNIYGLKPSRFERTFKGPKNGEAEIVFRDDSLSIPRDYIIRYKTGRVGSAKPGVHIYAKYIYGNNLKESELTLSKEMPYDGKPTDSHFPLKTFTASMYVLLPRIIKQRQIDLNNEEFILATEPDLLQLNNNHEVDFIKKLNGSITHYEERIIEELARFKINNGINTFTSANSAKSKKVKDPIIAAMLSLIELASQGGAKFNKYRKDIDMFNETFNTLLKTS